MRDDEDYFDLELDEADERYWTARRVVWLVIALLIITALIASMLWPLLYQIANPPLPPPTPRLGRI